MSKIILLGALCAASCLATAYTSSATGNWNSNGTWTPSGIPGNGDTVTLANGFAVTCPSSVTCIAGTSSTSAVVAIACSTDAGTGTLIVQGTLIYRGRVVQCNSNWLVSAGAILTHDSSLSMTPATTNYGWLIGNNDSSSTPPFLAMGGSSGSHVTVGIAASSGASGGFLYGPSAGSFDGGLIHGTFVDFTSCGTAAISCWFFSTSASNTGTASNYCNSCTFSASGSIYAEAISPGSTIQINNTRYSTGTATKAIDFENGYPARTTGVRQIQNSVVEGLVYFYFGAGTDSGFSFSNTFLDYLTDNGANSCDLYQGVFHNLYSTSTGSPTEECYGAMDSVYVFRWGYVGNPHYTAFDGFATSILATHFVGEPGGINSTDAGDFIQNQSVPASPQTESISYSTLLPDPTEISGGSFLNISAGGTAANITATLTQNTFTTDGTGGSLVGIGGENTDFPSGTFAAVRNNIAWCADPANCPGKGYITGHFNTGTVSSGAFTNSDYNVCWRCESAYYLSGLINSSFASPTPPGTHDQISNPSFQDATRRMVTFGQRYLGDATGTEWNTYSGATTFTVGQVVSHAIVGYYGGFPVNYRCILGHTKSASGSEPLIGANYGTYWEPATLQDLRTQVLAGTLYTDPVIGVTNAGVIQALVYWVTNGFSVTNTNMLNAGFGGVTAGSGGFFAPSMPAYCSGPCGIGRP